MVKSQDESGDGEGGDLPVRIRVLLVASLGDLINGDEVQIIARRDGCTETRLAMS